MLLDGVARQAGPPCDLPDRQLLPQRHASDDVQKSHVDHSGTPRRAPLWGRFTWVNSQWKLRAYPGQFQVEINKLWGNRPGHGAPGQAPPSLSGQWQAPFAA